MIFYILVKKHYISITTTYDHRLMRTGHPVRSAILKHQIGRLVVEWVTISEFLLLYVFLFCFDLVEITSCCEASVTYPDVTSILLCDIQVLLLALWVVVERDKFGGSLPKCGRSRAAT